MADQTLLVDFLERYHLPAIVFESPGCTSVYVNKAYNAFVKSYDVHSTVLSQLTLESRNRSYLGAKNTACTLSKTTDGSRHERTWSVTALDESEEHIVFIAQGSPTSLSSPQGSTPTPTSERDPPSLPPSPVVAKEDMILSSPTTTRTSQFAHDPRLWGIETAVGEMADRVRAHDWTSTPLGHPEDWDQTIVQCVTVVLRSLFPMSAYIGPEAFMIYNDGYITVLGPIKHPAALGLPAKVVWFEIWDWIRDDVEAVISEGRSVFRQRDQLFFNRLTEGPDPSEETYASWQYCPMYNADRKVVANLHVLYEEASTIIFGRRMEMLAKLTTAISTARSTVDLCRFSCESFSTLEIDLPFCLSYACRANETPTDEDLGGTVSLSSAGSNVSPDEMDDFLVFSLQETVGCEFDSAAAPSRVAVNTSQDVADADPSHPWIQAMSRLAATKQSVLVSNVSHLLAGVPPRGIPGRTAWQAVLVPLVAGEELAGCFVFFLNPALAYDTRFRSFIDMIGQTLSTSLLSVRAYENELQRNEELAALDRAKTSFFTSISHELRTPLTLILGPLGDLLGAKDLDRHKRSQIDLINRNAKRLLRLVNSILDFARLEAGKLASQFQPVPLAAMTSDLASSFRSAIEVAGIEYNVETTCEDCIVWIDVDKWEKIVYNLISNAFKYTSEGSVSIKTSVENDQYFVFAVSDTGAGIPPNELSSIFQRFHRIENAQARSVEGSGIGLSLCLELVKTHGGKLDVQSKWNHGSTFSVKIPLGSDHLPREQLVQQSTMQPNAKHYKDNMAEDLSLWNTNKSESESDMASGSVTNASTKPSSHAELFPPLLFGDRQRARVLLCDDNSDMRQYISSILSPFLDLFAVNDGKQAWDQLQEKEFDLVLSDIMMPHMTGFELLHEIRQSETLKRLPIILLSARAGEEASVEGLWLGADDYLVKPFSSKELILRTHTHLQLGVVRKELEARVLERTEALEQSKEVMSRLSDLLQVGIHRSERDGRIVWANKKWFSILGLNQESWNSWGNKIEASDLRKATQAYNETVTTGVGYKEPLEMRLINVDTKERFADITYDLQPEMSANGEITGFVGVFNDVTALRRLESERVDMERTRREEAENNRQLQEHFIDVTCHELRNPLNAIQHSAELLGESLKRFTGRQHHTVLSAEDQARYEAELAEDKEAVETIILCSRHQKRIADDVLHISKLSGGLVTLEKSAFNPSDAVANVLQMFSLEAIAKKIKLSCEVHASLDRIPSIMADEGRFIQVLVNLLSNAIKFIKSSNSPQIRVALGASPLFDDAMRTTYQEHSRFDLDDLLPYCQHSWPDSDIPDDILLHVAVLDTGPGMTDEERSILFQRFAQASPKTYRDFGGSGLGLWISRQLVELHGGHIVLQSKKNVGTIFRFYITAKRCEQVLPSTHALSASSHNLTVTSGDIEMDAPTDSIMSAGIQKPRSASLSNSAPLIFVVEDNAINQKVLVRLLKKLITNSVVVTANDGQDAVTQIEARSQADPTRPAFDLILMDLEMPILGGLGATRRIREMESQGMYKGRHSIVAVSANARAQFAQQAAASGMDSFMSKPYSREELQRVVETFLHSRDQDQA